MSNCCCHFLFVSLVYTMFSISRFCRCQMMFWFHIHYYRHSPILSTFMFSIIWTWHLSISKNLTFYQSDKVVFSCVMSSQYTSCKTQRKFFCFWINFSFNSKKKKMSSQYLTLYIYYHLISLTIYIWYQLIIVNCFQK